MTNNELINDAQRDPDLWRSNETLEFYYARRLEGMSHNFAAMLACQSFPGCKTEATYFEGRHTLAQQFAGNEAQLEVVVAHARARGFEPSPNMIYEPGLADDVGDPNAFISPSGGTTELRRKLEAAGKSCDGIIKVKGRAPRGPGAVGPLAQDLVDDMIATEAKSNPDLAARLREKPGARRELTEAIREHHGFTDAKRAGSFGSHVPNTADAIKRTPPVTKSPRPKRKKR